MSGPRAAAVRLSVMLVLASLTAGCGGGEDPVGEQTGGAVTSQGSAAQLQASRSAVGQAVDDLAAPLRRATGGHADVVPGQFTGCVSAGLETFRSMRYGLSGRLDVAPGTARPYLDHAADALGEAGWSVAEPADVSGGRALSATRDDVTLTLTERPAAGDFLTVDVSGPCIDIPPSDTQRWLRA